MLDATASCWEGLAMGSPTHARAEEGRSKLLLAALPEGVAAADEVAVRLSLWEAGNFEALLQKVEQQRILQRKTVSRTGPESKARRARRTAAEGAYRKATASLTSDMMSFDRSTDEDWARKLLPTAADPTAALTGTAPTAALTVEAAEQAGSFAPDDSPPQGRQVRFFDCSGALRHAARAPH